MVGVISILMDLDFQYTISDVLYLSFLEAIYRKTVYNKKQIINMGSDKNCCVYIGLNSYNSEETMIAMMNEFFNSFSITDYTVDDVFYHGVFFKPDTYANFSDWPDVRDFEIPSVLTESCYTEEERIAFVEQEIHNTMRDKLSDHPGWMFYIEEQAVCHGLMPSLYLVLEPKNDRFKALADAIIDFLYSVQYSTSICCE